MKITVVSLGPDSPEFLTLGAAEALLDAQAVLLRTGWHGVAAWLEKNRVQYRTLDALYDEADDFDELAQSAADEIVRFFEETPKGVYGVPDPACDETVAELVRRGAELKVLAGVTQASHARVQALEAGFPGDEGALSIPAADLRVQDINPSLPLVLTELDSKLAAGDLKLRLMEVYDAEMEVLLSGERIALEDLDRQADERYDHLTSVFLPASPLSARTRYTFGDLLDIMARLRRRGDGCPWDTQQTHESLRQYMLEEAHEVVAAINEGEPDRVADELGDVMLQVVFHSRIAEEHAEFTIADVTTAICGKMIHRHRHIFGDSSCATAEDVVQSWEQIKKEEKGLRSTSEAMRDVPASLPALMRASKVQNKAHQVGFDWDDPRLALDKISEENGEVREELDAGCDPEEEFGDLLFAAAHAARLCGVQPELALDRAVEKYISRFEYMEQAAKKDGKSLAEMTLSEMEPYWALAKRREKEAKQE